MKNKVLVSIIVLFSFTLGFSWYVWDHFINSPNSDNSEEVIYEVEPGRSFSSVAVELEQKGLIRNAGFFSFYARIQGQAGNMKVGEYLFRRDLRPSQVMQILTSGRSIERKITIPEGYNIYEIADVFQQAGLISAKDFLRMVKNPQWTYELTGFRLPSLEGFLYPETYLYTKYTEVKTIIQQMVKNFQEVFTEVLQQKRITGLSDLEILTLASIVEKETGAGFERPLVASVFHNRLKKGMLLQTDPTIIYGIADETGVIPKNIRKSDILRPTKYNTYVIKGLPPAPIANPGREALLATVQPAISEYFYFVSYNNGTHKFSKDYKEHAEAVRKYQQLRR